MNRLYECFEMNFSNQATADDVVAFAHELCPYSKATRGNVDVQLVAKV